jgi:hypothetical protein
MTIHRLYSVPTDGRAASGLRVADDRRALLAVLLAAPLALIAACGGGAGGVPLPAESIGKPVVDPATGLEFFLDDHDQGGASSVALLGMDWGRLVDIYSLENAGGVPKRVLRHADFLVGEDIRSDGIDYELATNPGTGVTSVTVLHSKVDDPSAYLVAFGGLRKNLGVIQVKSLDPSELPPFTFVPRNATVQLRFSDLLNHGSIDSETLRVRTGNPPTQPFEARILPDPNYGGLSSGGGLVVFRTTRVLIVPTITVLDALSADPPVQPNAVGYPASTTTALPNVAIFIPTEATPSVGQFGFLRNMSGAAVSQNGNGPLEPGGTSVVRAFRSGGAPDVTGDPNNGFLLDVEAPRIIGRIPLRLDAVNPIPGVSGEYRIDYQFLAADCGLQPAVGDVLDLPGGVVAEVLATGGPPLNGVVTDVHVRVLSEPAKAIEGLVGLVGSMVTAYDQALQSAPSYCFVQLSPAPLVSSGSAQANQLVSPGVSFSISFSEAMDPSSVAAFDTFSVLRDPAQLLDLENLVVGRVFPSSDLREFRFVPVLPLDTLQVQPYRVRIETGAEGVSDLSGNGVQSVFPLASFTLDPTAGPFSNSGHVLRFSGIDEDEGATVTSPGAEIAGQFLIDVQREVVKPRPVSRVTGTADRPNNPLVGSMKAYAKGVQTPLVPLGSRLMAVYRYGDLQWTSMDSINYNMDVEHIAWSPIGGQVNADSFDLFEMSLSHANKLPDEALNPQTGPWALLPKFPFSGLYAGGQPFAANVLSDPHNQLEVVHERGLGYVIDPANLFTNLNGTKLIPWPLNRTKAPKDYLYFTWRDTAIQGVIGDRGPGIDPQRMFNLQMPVTGMLAGDVAPGGLPASAGPNPGKQDTQLPGVPSIGMPLLMEFKCFPAQNTAVGLNALDISLAINSSARPNLRAFSSGGYNQSNQAVIKNPDLQSSPDGGFDPASQPPGMKTKQVADNSLYIGQVEFVVRVSRMHTRWFDTGDVNGRLFYAPVVEPDALLQPLGTQIQLHFRGADESSTFGAPLGGSGAYDAGLLDAYGDVPPPSAAGYPRFDRMSEKNVGVSFVPGSGDFTWKTAIGAIDGATFFQCRVTFINNAATGLSPELSALGFAHEGS